MSEQDTTNFSTHENSSSSPQNVIMKSIALSKQNLKDEYPEEYFKLLNKVKEIDHACKSDNFNSDLNNINNLFIEFYKKLLENTPLELLILQQLAVDNKYKSAENWFKEIIKKSIPSENINYLKLDYEYKYCTYLSSVNQITDVIKDGDFMEFRYNKNSSNYEYEINLETSINDDYKKKIKKGLFPSVVSKILSSACLGDYIAIMQLSYSFPVEQVVAFMSCILESHNSYTSDTVPLSETLEARKFQEFSTEVLKAYQ